MTANGRPPAGLGLRRLLLVIVCCFFTIVSPALGTASIPEARPNIGVASPDIGDEKGAAADDVLQSAVSEDVAADPSSGDIEPEETEWGTLSVAIAPERVRTSGARWSVDDGATWRQSGELILVPSGSATVTFNSIVGWKTPESIPVRISKESGANASATYDQLTGSIQVTLDGPSEAGWLVDGRTRLRSGAIREGLVPGRYTISFADVDKWRPPDERAVSVVAGETTALSAAYVHTGSVLVMIQGPAQARWNLGEKSLESGELLEDMLPGTYTISFSDVDMWEKPIEFAVEVLAGETARATAAYSPKIVERTGGDRVDRVDAGSPPPPSGHHGSGEFIERGEQATASTGRDVPETGTLSDTSPETDGARKPPSADEPSDPDKGKEAGKEKVDKDHEDRIEDENDTDKGRDKGRDKVVATPHPTPKKTPPEKESDTVPPEVVRPVVFLPELTIEERAEIAREIVERADSLDLGGAHPWNIAAFVPTEGTGLRPKDLSADENQFVVDILSSLIIDDAEGNKASPFLLRTASFEVDAGETDTFGMFLVVRVTFAVSHDELRSIDPGIVGRIDAAVAAGKTLEDALLNELHIFKLIGDEENARCFDLVEKVRGRGFALDRFFKTRPSEGFFETIAQDKGYTIIFRLLLFDGPTNDPRRLVQPLEGSGIIVFDGVRDGKFSDPIVLAAARPENIESDSSKNSGGCRTLSGGAGMLLFLLPAFALLLRRNQ